MTLNPVYRLFEFAEQCELALDSVAFDLVDLSTEPIDQL
jgi:hypothetical protein